MLSKWSKNPLSRASAADVDTAAVATFSNTLLATFVKSKSIPFGKLRSSFRYNSFVPPPPGIKPTPNSTSPIYVSARSEEHTSELQSRGHLVCRLLLEKK